VGNYLVVFPAIATTLLGLLIGELLMTSQSMASQPVLIDRDYLLVHQNVFRGVVHFAQVVARKQWCSQYRPQAHLRAILIGRHTSIANLQHVRIVPMFGPCVLSNPT
jgi:hypothetical protein